MSGNAVKLTGFLIRCRLVIFNSLRSRYKLIKYFPPKLIFNLFYFIYKYAGSKPNNPQPDGHDRKNNPLN